MKKQIIFAILLTSAMMFFLWGWMWMPDSFKYIDGIKPVAHFSKGFNRWSYPAMVINLILSFLYTFISSMAFYGLVYLKSKKDGKI